MHNEKNLTQPQNIKNYPKKMSYVVWKKLYPKKFLYFGMKPDLTYYNNSSFPLKNFLHFLEKKTHHTFQPQAQKTK